MLEGKQAQYSILSHAADIDDEKFNNKVSSTNSVHHKRTLGY